jgi:predicted TIM-barrel fold metal-dependent hydrolase
MVGTDRYLIISSDCHAGLPTADYRDYLDPQYRDAFDESVRRAEAMRGAMSIMDPAFARKWEEENEEGLRGGWDAERRDKELDGDGVAGEVLFPTSDAVSGTTSAPFGAGLSMSADVDPELMLAGARAHNRWLAELCAVAPERRAGVALVPILHDPDAAVVEIAWAHDAGLRGGILIPSLWGKYPAYYDARYDPVWAACQDLDMPVHTHSGAAGDTYGDNIGLYTTETTWWSARPLWFLIWSGVFERYPRLKFAVTECLTSWVPELLWRMDTGYLREHGSKKLGHALEAKLTMKPSEYFDRNCYMGASTMKRREIALRYEIGVGNIMWGNDFPHPEGSWPHTIDWLRQAFADVPVDETRQMLGTTAAAVYNFDVDALAPLVARIGPTPEDLGQVPGASDKWRDAARVGRHWLTDLDPVPVTALA